MSFNLGTAVGYLDLDTSKFKRGFNSALGDLETFSSKTSTASQKTYALGSAMTSAGSTLTKNVTLPLAGIGTAAIGVTAKFDSAMSQVAAVSGATGDSLDALREKAKEMGATTKFSASDAADAMNYMAMAGWKTEDMLNGISGIMDLAAASGEDLASTSDIVTDALTAFGLTAADSGHFADVLAAASSNANTNVSMMGETFKYCAPIAGSLGYSVEDTAEAIGLMANAGIKSTQAGTALRTIMTRLAGKVKICGASLGEVAIATSNADGSMRAFSDILADCRVAFDGLSESEQASAAEALVGKNAMSGFLAIMNAASTDIDKLSSAIDGCDGTSKQMAETMQDNLGGQLTILKSTLEGLAIAIGELLMPFIRKITSGLQELLTKLSNLSEEQKKTIVTIAGVVAAIGPVLTIFGKLLKTIGSMPASFKSAGGALKSIGAAFAAIPPPVYIIIAIIALLTGAFVTLWKTNEEFRNKVVAIWEGIKETFTSFFGQLTEKINSLGFEFENFGEVLKALWMKLCEFLGPLIIGAFNDIWTGIKAALDVILGVVDFFIALFQGDWEGVWNAVKDIFGTVWDSIVAIIKNNFGVIMEQLNIICGWFGTTWESVWNSIKAFFVSTWTSIVNFFVGVWTSVKDFFVGLWEGIVGAIQAAWDLVVGLFSTIAAWVYDNVIAPIAQFFMGLWNSIVSAYHTVIDPWIEIFRRISVIVYDEIVQPIVQFFTDLWNSIVSGLTTAWEWITELLATVAGWVDENVIQPVATFFSTMWQGVSDAATQCWEAIQGVWQTVSEWFNTKIVQPVKNLFAGVWSTLKTGASGAWSGIKSVFSSVATFFGNVFKTAWEKVKAVFSTGGKIFSGIKEGIVKAFKTVVNAIIKGINKVVKLPFQGLNGILDKLYKLTIVGVKPFSWLTWRAPIPNIPLLAEGAVLPANNPFLAIVGDQKHGTNVEAPLSTIQEAVALVLKSFTTPMIRLQEMTVVILGDILQAVIGVNQLQSKLQNFHEATRQSAFSGFDFQAASVSGIDYAKLAAYLAAALQSAPIKADVKVEMQDGDVYLDKERVGRSLAPTVSRIITQKN